MRHLFGGLWARLAYLDRCVYQPLCCRAHDAVRTNTRDAKRLSTLDSVPGPGPGPMHDIQDKNEGQKFNGL